MVTVECIESKKSEGHTNIQRNKQTNKQTREPLGKGEVTRVKSTLQCCTFYNLQLTFYIAHLLIIP